MTLPADAIPFVANMTVVWASPQSKAQCETPNASKIEIPFFTTKFRYAAHPRQLGYISGVVTEKGVIARGRRVVLLSSDWAFVAETRSDDQGKYQFDGLLLGRFYTVIAQDNDDYKYAPVGADRRTPEAYS